MKLGIYCNNFSKTNLDACEYLISILKEEGIQFSLFKALSEELKSGIDQNFDESGIANDDADILITIGGDGTILNAVGLIVGTSVPILGVNTGRLGFLTSISPEEFKSSIKAITSGAYKTEERALLEMSGIEMNGLNKRYALNEISVLKKDSSSMITINAEIDGSFLNTYWADGLIVSTATGSTAYSLSCGGPIVEPGSGNFVVTPIAPHNLNVRPMIIPDSSEITLSFESRSGDLLVAVDSSSQIIPENAKLKISKSTKSVGLLRLTDYSYFDTLRKKLNWGLDKRN